MDLVQPQTDALLRFISSAESDASSGKDEDLLLVAYTRVQSDSPEFLSTYEGINQSVDINISTFKFRVAPEPIILLYDFIMTTFAPPTDTQPTKSKEIEVHAKIEPDASRTIVVEERLRVLLKLARVQGQFALVFIQPYTKTAYSYFDWS